MKEQVIEQLRTVFDPEIALNIYDLGLIYDISFEKTQTFSPDGEDSIQENKCKVLMTLTSAWCPVAQEMPVWVKNAVMKISGIHDCDVKITFEPEWNRDSISDTGKLELGFI